MEGGSEDEVAQAFLQELIMLEELSEPGLAAMLEERHFAQHGTAYELPLRFVHCMAVVMRSFKHQDADAMSQLTIENMAEKLYHAIAQAQESERRARLAVLRLEEAKEDHDRESAQQEARLREVTQTLDERVGQQTRVAHEWNAARDRVVALEQQVEAAQSTRAAQLKHETAERQMVADKAASDVSAAHAEVQQLYTQLHASEARLTEAQREVERYKAKCASMQRQLQGAKQESAGLAQKYDEAVRESLAKDEELETLVSISTRILG